jgi:hypothetical protein
LRFGWECKIKPDTLTAVVGFFDLNIACLPGAGLLPCGFVSQVLFDLLRSGHDSYEVMAYISLARCCAGHTQDD